jgi:hypothetical protein
MLHASRSHAALFICGSFVAGAVVFLACTGDDPVLTPFGDVYLATKPK